MYFDNIAIAVGMYRSIYYSRWVLALRWCILPLLATGVGMYPEYTNSLLLNTGSNLNYINASGQHGIGKDIPGRKMVFLRGWLDNQIKGGLAFWGVNKHYINI